MSDYAVFHLSNGKLKSSTNPNLPPVNINQSPNGECRDPDVGTCGLIRLNLEESLFSPTVKGEAYLRDYDGSFVSALGSYIGLGGYDILELDFNQGGPGTTPYTKTLYFMIYAYSQITDEVHSLGKSDSSPRVIVLKLASPEFALLNYLFFEYFENNEDIIMPISRILTEEEESEQEGNFSGQSPSAALTQPAGSTACVKYDKEGFVQYLVSRMNQYSGYDTPLFSENTKNWIWLKKNFMMYPWGKMTSAPRVNQLIEMMAENAVHEENEFAANFLFWRALDSWNFYSLETLVQQQPKKTYNLAENLNCPVSILNLTAEGADEGTISSYDEADFLDLMRSYAFGSNYLSVNPNYCDPYARYLDSASAHIIKEISYDYFNQGTLWSKLPNDEFGPALGAVVSCGDGFITYNSKNNRITDNNYGYFSPGFFNREKQVAWEYYGYTYASRQEKTLWQTQFDITEIPGEDLYSVMKKVKQPLQKAREKYAALKNLKERWKVYKCSICCAGDIDSNPGGTAGFTATYKFNNPNAEKAFNLRNSAGALSNYEIVAAGSFTDTINFDASKIGVGFTGFTYDAEGKTLTDDAGNPIYDVYQNEWTRSGMTLSYDLNDYPYNYTIGDFFGIEQFPDNFIKYKFDLEINRHILMKEVILRNNQNARATRIQKYDAAIAGYTAAYINKMGQCTNSGCTGYCTCPTEYPEIVEARANIIKQDHANISDSELWIRENIDPVITRLKALKEEFTQLYDKFWSRKAFFFSRDIDFSFLKSENNLFNIKSIKRIPIVGSKYEPFALRQAVGSYPFKSGKTFEYPYKPSQYNIYWGLGAQEPTNVKYYGQPFSNTANYDKSPYYERGYRPVPPGISYAANDYWGTFDLSNDFPPNQRNFNYTEGDQAPVDGPIWYKNWLVEYEITLIKPPCLNRKPACSDDDCSCDEIKIPLKMHFETFAGFTGSIGFTGNTIVSNIALRELSRNCDGCKIRILDAKPSSGVRLYHPWGADWKYEVDNGRESTNYDPDSFRFADYKRSSSFYSGQREVPRMELESYESYVRVEFMTPIGLGTLKDFPEGFIDTYGSEYFLPYIVLATAGPFGSQSARTNISVIGQDPYGFDLAIKKIKNRDDFANMNLVYTDGASGFAGPPSGINRKLSNLLANPFGTSSSWMRSNQNALFYKPNDGVSDVFTPNGIQDLFMAANLEKSVPAKTWWDLWISLPPTAISTYYNRWDVAGAFEGSLEYDLGGDLPPGVSYVGIGFYSNNSIVAEPYTWTGLSGCCGGCQNDPPWPLFLQPDTEQIASGAIPSDVYVTEPTERRPESGEIDFTLSEGSGYQGTNVSALTDDPMAYDFSKIEFPHIRGISGVNDNTPLPYGIRESVLQKVKYYSQVSYPIGTLIWGPDYEPEYLKDSSGEFVLDEDGNKIVKTGVEKYIHMWDMSRKTQYGLVQLNSDSMPSLLTMIGGVGGDIETLQEYNKWVSKKLIDWFQNTIFDNNFAAQFVVLSRESDGCKDYPCMNPDGFPGMEGCSAGNPLCNCPCKDIRPDVVAQGLTGFAGLSGNLGKEPSSLEIKYWEKQISECNLIEKEPCLGKDWLGCVWDDPYSTMNCNCPCIGKKFCNYLGINRTNATFWGTPLATPLFRTAQMTLFNSNKIKINVYGDITVRSGDVVLVNAYNQTGYSRFHGYWVVSSIEHSFIPERHSMTLTLSRELPHPCKERG